MTPSPDLIGPPPRLGAVVDHAGIHFTVFSAHAEHIELCVFAPDGQQETLRQAMHSIGGGIWHVYLAGAQAGLIYGYRAYGPFAPQQGHRFNPAKLLLDPYAQAVVGQFRDDPRFLDHRLDNPSQPDLRDTGNIALKAQVIDEPFDWQSDHPPAIPWAETLIYEAHVRGLTQLHPDIPVALQGSYAGLGHPAMIAHLKKLGITSLELMPIHLHLDEPRLQRHGLSNYWGYNPIALFAPETRYWSKTPGSTPLSELRNLVKTLHAAGVEVILDVVFNHSAELDLTGPTLSLRGLDNASYYVQKSGEYENWTGCGNALNLSHPRVVQLVMDCLRFWVTQCHIDGFRFDLATTLARLHGRFEGAAGLLTAISQDPLLARCKWIAEPWDIGPAGYQLGQYPPGWAEWNDQFRDTMRQFWLHDRVTRADFARRFAASSDLFEQPTRAPWASINYITAHDGFTLSDLVTWNHRNNLANKEHNHDGHSQNHSWNCGVDGPTTDPGIQLLRLRAKKALLATLILAQGTPMLLAGDELGHSQQGNNNAYCQDNPITWLNWQDSEKQLTDYVAQLIALRQEIPALHAPGWWQGQADAQGIIDVEWLNPSGQALQPHDWEDPSGRALMIRFSGQWLLLINASAHQLHFNLPEGQWQLRLASTEDVAAQWQCRDYAVAARSVTVLEQVMAEKTNVAIAPA